MSGASAQVTALIASLPDPGNMVCVGPPLFAKATRFNVALLFEVAALKSQLVPSSRLPPLSVRPNLPQPPAMMVLVTVPVVELALMELATGSVLPAIVLFVSVRVPLTLEMPPPRTVSRQKFVIDRDTGGGRGQDRGRERSCDGRAAVYALHFRTHP